MKKLSLIVALFVSITATAQKTSIEGIIYGENQAPLQGISIQLDGTKIGTATDNDGHFYLHNVPFGSYVVIASSIGFSAKSKAINVGENKIIIVNFQLFASSTILEEVTIKAKSNLVIENTSTLTRTNTPVKDLPQSIQSISRSTINEQQIYTVDEALKNVAGVNVSSNYGTYNFRGFTTSSASFLTNGMKGRMFPEGVTNSLANVESIEVLRGPSAILFGENALGGNINFTTKQPKKTSTGNASISVGSFGLLRTQADVKGSLNKSKSLYYVAGFGFENGGKITKDWKNQNALLFTALKWEVSDKTGVQVNLNYNYDNRTSNYAIAMPFIKGNIFSTPQEFNFHSNDAMFKGNSYQFQLQLHHKLNNNWGLHLLTGLSQSNENGIYYGIGDYVDTKNENKVERIKTYSKTKINTPTINAYTTGAFKTGKIKYTLTVGVDVHKENWDYPNGYRIYTTDSISVTNPNYTPFILPPGPTGADYLYSTYELFQLKTYGVYLQNQFDINKKWKGIIGLRYNHYENFYRADSVSFNNFEDYLERPLNTTAFIPRVGVVFQPSKKISLYADYNSGFQPQFANNRQSGGPFQPETTSQFEIGAKGDFLNGQLIPTIAFYHINKNNVLTPDLNDAAGILLKPLGQVRSKGFEATLTGAISSNWSMILNYAYNETTITKSNDSLEIGQKFDNTPKHIASIWTTYAFSKKLKGLKFGAGYRHTSDRYIRNVRTDNLKPVILPSYSVADMMAQYEYKQFNLIANINNLFDKVYAQGSVSSRSIFRGLTRNYLITLAYKF